MGTVTATAASFRRSVALDGTTMLPRHDHPVPRSRAAGLAGAAVPGSGHGAGGDGVQQPGGIVIADQQVVQRQAGVVGEEAYSCRAAYEGQQRVVETADVEQADGPD